MAKKGGRLYYTVTKQYPLHYWLRVFRHILRNQWYSLKFAKGWNIDSRLITSQMLETLGFNGAHDMPGNSEVSSWMVIIKGPTQLHYCRAQ